MGARTDRQIPFAKQRLTSRHAENPSRQLALATQVLEQEALP